MDSSFVKLPAKFNNDRIFLYPITDSGHQLEFYTDTGGGGMIINSATAKDLELPIIKKVIENGEEYSLVPFPKFEEKAAIPVGTKSNELVAFSDMLLGKDGFLGQPWFADRIWFLDYLNKEMGYNTKGAPYDTTGFRGTWGRFSVSQYYSFHPRKFI